MTYVELYCFDSEFNAVLKQEQSQFVFKHENRKSNKIKPSLFQQSRLYLDYQLGTVL